MEVNAIQQMLSRLKQVQEDLQRQVNSVAVEASAGGGMVVVRMNGEIRRCCRIWSVPRSTKHPVEWMKS
jgi:DNA-binding protein YbaB